VLGFSRPPRLKGEVNQGPFQPSIQFDQAPRTKLLNNVSDDNKALGGRSEEGMMHACFHGREGFEIMHTFRVFRFHTRKGVLTGINTGIPLSDLSFVHLPFCYFEFYLIVFTHHRLYL
jgi:hypothetical protein